MFQLLLLGWHLYEFPPWAHEIDYTGRSSDQQRDSYVRIGLAVRLLFAFTWTRDVRICMHLEERGFRVHDPRHFRTVQAEFWKWSSFSVWKRIQLLLILWFEQRTNGRASCRVYPASPPPSRPCCFPAPPRKRTQNDDEEEATNKQTEFANYSTSDFRMVARGCSGDMILDDDGWMDGWMSVSWPARYLSTCGWQSVSEQTRKCSKCELSTQIEGRRGTGREREGSLIRKFSRVTLSLIVSSSPVRLLLLIERWWVLFIN